MATAESIVELIEIPEWTRADFESTEPFEWLYNYRENKFLFMQLREQVKARAGNVGFRNFITLLNAYLESKANDSRIELERATQFDGQAVELYCGNYICNDDGVSYYDRQGAPIIVCRHPILPVSRLVNIDTGEMKLEIAFKRGSRWRTVIISRAVLASQQKILDLSNLGVAVDSENAKELVKYITFIESQNYEKLGEVSSVGRLGWIEGQGFSPYVDDLRFDGDLTFSHMFDAIRQEGNVEEWIATAVEARKNSLITRIILAASFASALVEPLGCLPFFLHVWGGTEAGKTVGLMLGASVWANPALGEYIKTFNSTSVGLEMAAGFCNSLPLCLDELQIIRERGNFDKTIYMLTEGIGKGRGAKNGGLQRTQTWKNCILTTGEMPITNSESGGGAVNRIIEIDCKDEKLFTDPRAVANSVRANYGWAGVFFANYLQNPDNIAKAKELYQDFYAELTKGESTDKQAMAAALILTADALTADTVYYDGLKIKPEEIAKYLTSRHEVDANARALNWLHDFVATNSIRFSGGEHPGEVWGEISGKYIYIIKSVFDEKMKAAGFSPQSFLSWAMQRGILDTSLDGSNRTTKKKRIKGTNVASWCVCILQDGEEGGFNVDELPF